MSKKFILIINSDEKVNNFLQKAFQKLNYKVKVIKSLRRATKIIEQNGIDVVLMELEKGADGIRHIKAINPDINVIVIAGKLNTKIALQAIKWGAYDYLIKPIEEQEAIFVITRSIEKMELQKSVNKMKKIALIAHLGEALAHEIFNPMNILSLNSQLILSHIGEDEKKIPKRCKECFSFISRMSKQINRCTEILNLFRRFYKDLDIKIEHLTLNDMLKKLIEGKL